MFLKVSKFQTIRRFCTSNYNPPPPVFNNYYFWFICTSITLYRIEQKLGYR